MENINLKTKKKNRAIKSIVGAVSGVISIAAVVVPVTLTSTSGKDGKEAEALKYEISISSNIEGYDSYGLSVKEGTKISELKSMLKAIDGYRITGVFKDEAMKHEYANNEIIEGNAKIYIKFEVSQFTVKIFDENKNIVDTLENVEYDSTLEIVTPEKQEDDFASYEFTGWVNEKGESVNLDGYKVQSDLEIYPTFKTIMKDYRIGFSFSGGNDYKKNFKVTIGGEDKTVDDTYHFGSEIKIRVDASIGHTITEFSVKVGEDKAVSYLSDEFAVKDEYNRVLYYEISLKANGNLLISYSEVVEEFSLGTIPQDVTVKKNGVELESNAVVYFDDVLEITYKTFEDYLEVKFSVGGTDIVSENQYRVTGDVSINFEYKYKYDYLIFEKVDGGYKVASFNNSDVTDAVIPATHRGEKVIEIAANAFENAAITSVTISENIKNIGREAFLNCRHLTEINYNATEAEVMIDLENEKFSDIFKFAGVDGAGTQVNIGDNVKVIPAGLFAALDENCFDNVETFKGLSNIKSVLIGSGVTEIGSSAFAFLPNLENIVIPENVEFIGSGAFSYNVSLKSIKLPSKIKTIENYTFVSCVNLSSIEIPSGVTEIKKNAFIGCTALETVTLPDTIISLGESVFEQCSNLRQVNLPSGLQVIEASLFSDCTNLESVSIPSSVSSIGYNAFYGCTSLTKLVLPENLTSIGSNAFAGCTILSKLVLPENLTSIGLNAFAGCTGISEIIIPASVQSIGSSAFASCINLANVTINSESIYASANGSSDSNAGGLLQNAKEIKVNLSIDDGTNSYLSGETFASISDGTYNIYSAAENYSSYLSFVQVSDGYAVTALNDLGLMNVIIPNTYKGLPITEIGRGAFDGARVKNVNIPATVHSIGDEAFANCSILSKIEIPSNVTYIGAHAFANDSRLTSITIPEKVSVIGKEAFYNCSKLAEINYNAENASDFMVEDEDNGLISTGIFREAGRSNSGITVNIGSSVKRLPAGIFYYSYFDMDNEIFESPKIVAVNFEEGTTSIGSHAFKGLSELTEIQLPSTLQSIESEAFSHSGLISIIVPESVTNMGISVFANARSLASVKLSSNLTRIEYGTFSGCLSLSEFTLSENIDSIGNNAFKYSGLTSLSLPAGVTNIGASAFEGSKLSEIVLSAGLETIGASAFRGTNLTNISLPINIESIGSNAFENCTNLTSIVLPDFVQEFGVSIFYNCTSLQSVTLKEGMTSIPDYMFGLCTSLTQITLPSTIEYIGQSAFENCLELAEIVLPASVGAIHANAFANCDKLTKVTINSVEALAAADAETNMLLKNATEVKVLKTIDTYNNSVLMATNNGFVCVEGDEYNVYTLADEYSVIVFELNEAGDGYIVDGYNETEEVNIILPKYYKGLPVTEIRNYAFSGISFVSIVIPETVKVIGSSAFDDCTSLESLVVDVDNTVYTSRNLDGTEVNAIIHIESKTLVKGIADTIIPDDGSVTIIGENAFLSDSRLTSIVIPYGVTEIKANAFSNCTGLEEVILPSTLLVIGNAAFAGCEFSSITLPAGLTTIGANAFSYNPNLSSIVIPNSVTSIGDYAFYECFALSVVTIDSASVYTEIFITDDIETGEEIIIPGFLTAYANEVRVSTGIDDGSNIFLNGDYAKILSTGYNIYIKDAAAAGLSFTLVDGGYSVAGHINPFMAAVNIPNTFNGKNIVAISDNAFVDTGITSVQIGDNVQTIGKKAFHNCTSLTSVEFGAGVQTIGNDCFKYSGLTSVSIPDSVTTLGTNAFANCTGLEFASIGNGVSLIPESTFYNCTSLSEVTFGSEITEIAKQAFKNTAIISINVPNSVTSIGEAAFQNVATLKTITFETGSVLSYIGVGAFSETGLFAVTLPASMRTIEDKAFQKCSSLESLTIAEGLESIGLSAFAYTNITSAILPDSLTTLGERAFAYCSKMQNLCIGTGLIEIGASAFRGTSSLGKVNVNEGSNLSVIGDNAFQDSSLYAFDTDYIDTLSSIGVQAFKNCNRLQMAPFRAISIGKEAFRNCTSLEEAYISRYTTTIGDSAFQDCTAITEINYYAIKLNNVPNKIFRNVGTAGNGVSVRIQDTVQAIPARLFYANSSTEGIPNVTSVWIGSNVTSVGEKAFQYLGNLKEITINSAFVYQSANKDDSTHAGGLIEHFFDNIQKVYVPKTIVNSNTNTFLNRSGLKFDSGTNYVFEFRETAASNFSYTYSSTYGGYKITEYLGTAEVVRIPKTINGYTVTEIGRAAFEYDILNTYSGTVGYIQTQISVISLPDGLRNIDEFAFKRQFIKSVKIPSSTSSMGMGAFSYCSYLEYVDFGGINSIPSNAFAHTKLREVVITDGIGSIGNNAFYNCSSLVSVSIGDGVTSIGDKAFEDCVSLERIVVGDNVRSLGTYAFARTYKLKTIYWNATNCTQMGTHGRFFYQSGKNSTGINVIFGENVRHIPERLFYVGASDRLKTPNVKYVYIPQSVQSIGDRAFQYLYNMETVEIRSLNIYNVAFKVNSQYGGGILQFAKNVYIEESIDLGTNKLLNEQYSYEDYVDDYNVYIRVIE